jgi:glycosyltransferase involved in cell wall biosynthesis
VDDELAPDKARPLVIASLLPETGSTGVHTHVRELRSYLAGRGAAHLLVTPSWGRRPAAYRLLGTRRALRRVNRPAGVAWWLHSQEVLLRDALGRTLARLGECVVYAQDPLAARAALRTRRGPHQRVVLAVHFRTSLADEFANSGDVTPDGVMFRSIRRLEREVVPRVDRTVYVSQWGRDVLHDWLPEAAAVPSVIIGNFVARRPSGSPPTTYADLVTTGSLEPVKNHRFLLAVLAEAKRAGRRFTLDIFGEGPLRADLEREARSLGLEEQVRFRGFRAEVRDFLPGYRAYVHASRSESLPLAIIEAMEAGLPIVAGDTGGVSEICDDGVEARFWSLDDPAEAAGKLIDLLESEPARSRAASAAVDRFRRDFDVEVLAPRLLSFLLGPTVTSSELPLRERMEQPRTAGNR